MSSPYKHFPKCDHCKTNPGIYLQITGTNKGKHTCVTCVRERSKTEAFRRTPREVKWVIG